MDIDFTNVAWESLYEAVDDEHFFSEDAELIYHSLKEKFPVLAFGDFLRRYIYQKAEMTEPFSAVPLEDYQEIIKQSFRDYDTPPSFEPTKTKMGALTKNWLTQNTVHRKVVFLLGFGLSMTATDVNQFLTKALREQEINPKDPFEVICWYCYKNKFQFPKYEELWETYETLDPWSFAAVEVEDDRTMILHTTMKSITTEKDLLEYLSRLKVDQEKSHMRASGYKTLQKLYQEGCQVIAELYNSEGTKRVYTPDEITESDFENIICSAIRKDKNGNMLPIKQSGLNEQFYGKRLSRQRLRELLAEKIEVNRFDLITLQFFNFSQKLDLYHNVRQRYTEFCEQTNKLLEECFMGKLYVSNPYERFVLMCILSEDPLGTYADVWEMSYQEEE